MTILDAWGVAIVVGFLLEAYNLARCAYEGRWLAPWQAHAVAVGALLVTASMRTLSVWAGAR
jgi:hypothetical protein